VTAPNPPHQPFEQQPWPPQQVSKQKRRVGLLAAVVLAAAVGAVSCLGGLAIGQSAGDAAGQTTTTAPVAPATTRASTAAPTPPPATTAAAKPPAPAKPAPAQIAQDGVHMVPGEVKPGTYRTTVPPDSFGCYWARLKGTSGQFEDTIANGNGTAGQRMTVTVKASDKAFNTEHCGTWTQTA
jgi:hypothetical protein